MKKLIGALCFSLLIITSASAQAPAPATTPAPTAAVTDKPMVPSVSDVFKDGNGRLLGESTTLEDYSTVDDFSHIVGGNDDPLYKGAFQIRNILTVLMNFVAKMMVPVAILFLLWAAISLLTERGDESRFQQRVRQLIWTGAGFLLFFFAFAIVDYMVFGVQGEIFQGGNMSIFGEMAQGEVLGFVRFASSFVVALAVMYMVFGALQLILLGEQEEQQKKIRRQIIFTIIGVLVIIFANTLANTFFGGTPGVDANLSVNSGALISILIYWANLILGFIGLAAVIAIIWSGVQMILHFGNEEALGRSKKIIMYAVIGLVLAFSAFTIVRFFLTPGAYGSNEPNPADRLNPYDQIIVTP